MITEHAVELYVYLILMFSCHFWAFKLSFNEVNKLSNQLNYLSLIILNISLLDDA